jgi:hypothetical protein
MTDPQLRDDLLALDNNTYGSLHGVTSLRALGNGFAKLGWTVRETAWDEVETECRWCRITLFDAGGQTTFAGVVDPDRDRDLALILTELGLGYRIELYDVARNLIHTLDPDTV